MNKQRMNIVIDVDTYLWVKQEGINISQTCNEYLRLLKTRRTGKRDIQALRNEVSDAEAHLAFLEMEYQKLKMEEKEKKKEEGWKDV